MGILGGLLGGLVTEIVKGVGRAIKGTGRAAGRTIRRVPQAVDGRKTYLGTLLGAVVVTLELLGYDVPGVAAVDENWLAMYIGLAIIAALRHGIRKAGG